MRTVILLKLIFESVHATEIHKQIPDILIKKKFNAQFIFGIFRQTPLQVLDVSTNHPYGVPSDDGLQIRPKHIEVFHEIYRR